MASQLPSDPWCTRTGPQQGWHEGDRYECVSQRLAYLACQSILVIKSVNLSLFFRFPWGNNCNYLINLILFLVSYANVVGFVKAAD